MTMASTSGIYPSQGTSTHGWHPNRHLISTASDYSTNPSPLRRHALQSSQALVLWRPNLELDPSRQKPPLHPESTRMLIPILLRYLYLQFLAGPPGHLCRAVFRHSPPTITVDASRVL